MPIGLEVLGIDEEKVIRFLKVGCKAEIGFYGRNPEDDDKPVSAETATILLALYYTGYLSAEEKKRWARELLRFQIQSGDDVGSFCKNEGSSVWATSWSIWAFFELHGNYNENKKIEDAVDWLLDAQENGGWGFYKSNQPRAFYTYYAYRALKAAYKKLKWPKLKLGIENSVKYIVQSQLKESPGTWGDGISEFSLADTAMALSLLREEEKEFPNLIKPSDISCAITNILDKLRKEGNYAQSWGEHSGIGSLKFDYTFFTPALLIILLKCNVRPFNVCCLRLLSWFKNNVIEYDREESGWSGDVQGLSGAKTPYAWTTALSIIALNSWLKELSKCKQIEIVNYFDNLTNSNTPVRESNPEISRIQSQLVKSLKDKEKTIRRMKNALALLAFGTISWILYSIDFPHWLLLIMSIEMPPTIAVNLLVSLVGGGLLSLLGYVLSKRKKQDKSKLGKQL